MSKDKETVLAYLDSSSSEQKAVSKFIKQLSEMVINSGKGDYAGESSKFDTDFKDLSNTVKDIKIDFVPYSEITRIIYTCDTTDGLDMFFMQFNSCLVKNIKNIEEEKADISSGDVFLIKTLEHMKLANKQVDSLYKKQDQQIKDQTAEINKQKVKIDEQNKNLAEQTKKLVEQTNNLTDIEKKLKGVKKKLKKFDDIKSSVYGDFIAILGIFSALIFTLFGGFGAFTTAISQISKGVSIARVAIFLSLLGIVMLCLLFFLLKAIATMSDKKLTLKDKGCLYKKYPFFTWGLTIISTILLCSLIYDYCTYH